MPTAVSNVTRASWACRACDDTLSYTDALVLMCPAAYEASFAKKILESGRRLTNGNRLPTADAQHSVGDEALPFGQ